MKLSSSLSVFVLVISALTVCHAERDLTLACGLDLNDCRAALAAAESSCAVPEPAPTPTSPTPPTAPTTEGTLEITGNDGEPPEAFPMNLCEGDCDADSDCSGNLVCFQRDDGDDVPGCIGVADPDGTDYCCDTSFDGCVSSEGGGGGGGGGFVSLLLELFLSIFGQNRRRLEVVDVPETNNNDQSNRQLLFFGLLNRECQALLERCEENLAAFSCQPTVSPTLSPTLSPTKSQMPSDAPNPSPSAGPTITAQPTRTPTKRPTKAPTKAPTRRPTRPPTVPPVKQMGMGKRELF